MSNHIPLPKVEPIDSFRGEFFFLSNFYACPLMHDGIRYPTAEHAFQAAKTLDFAERIRISQLGTPAAAKQAGRELQLRPDWEARLRVPTMQEIVVLKFVLNPALAARLVNTGTRPLIEGNMWHDNFWGDCRCSRLACREPGYNYLGRIQMHLRQQLR